MQLEGVKVGASIRESQSQQKFDQESSGVKLGAQIAKDQKELNQPTGEP